MTFKRNAVALCSGLTLCVLAAGLMCTENTVNAAQPAAPTPPLVTVAEVVQREVRAWDTFSARLEAVEQVAVRARVAGEVQAIHFREGQRVTQGDLLVSLDPALYAAEVARAEARLAAASARQAFTRSEAQRALRLIDSQTIARSDAERRQNDAREADAALQEARAALHTAQLNLGYTQIRAAVSGRVGRREVTVGNLVGAGPDGPVLTQLVSTSPIHASFDIDEATLLQALHAPTNPDAVQALPVQMQGVDGRRHEGQVQWLDNQLDARSGTLRLRALFDNPDGSLVPGQFARVSLGQAAPFVGLLVDERALGTDQDRRYVLVLGEDNRVAYRQVSLGARIDGLRVVSAGLAPGERVVVEGLQRVRPGTQITPRVIDMPVAQSSATIAPLPRS